MKKKGDDHSETKKNRMGGGVKKTKKRKKDSMDQQQTQSSTSSPPPSSPPPPPFQRSFFHVIDKGKRHHPLSQKALFSELNACEGNHIKAAQCIWRRLLALHTHFTRRLQADEWNMVTLQTNHRRWFAEMTLTGVRDWLQHIDDDECEDGQKAVNKIPKQRRVPWLMSDKLHRQIDEMQSAQTFRVMSYNILANCYMRSDRHPGVLPENMPWKDVRGPRIIRTLQTSESDVIALQEVEREAYHEILHVLESDGYAGVFHPKISPNNVPLREGCAYFWRTSAFTCVSHHSMPIHQIPSPQSWSCYGHVRRSSSSSSRIHSYPHSPPPSYSHHHHQSEVFFCDNPRRQRQQQYSPLTHVRKKAHIVSVLELQCRVSQRKIIFGNTHLFYSPRHPHVKVLQIALVLNYLHQIKYQRASSSGGGNHKPIIDLILCGDLNSLPADSGVVHLLRCGSVPVTHPHHPYQSTRCTHTITPILNPLQMTCAVCDTHPQATIEKDRQRDEEGEEREEREESTSTNSCYHLWTTHTQEFSGTLDYIFFDTSRHSLAVLGVLDMPHSLPPHPLPDAHNPSDHIPIVIDFALLGGTK